MDLQARNQLTNDFDTPNGEGYRPTVLGRLDAPPTGLKVMAVGEASALFAYVRPGYTLRSINGEPVSDIIDFHFKMADGDVDLLFESDKGNELLFEFEDATIDELGLTFDSGRMRTCKNDCIFCFIKQQPTGMRRSLYVKDEDYRYSFTHGNFITLSNTTDKDIARIIEQRLSPLYISVHTTNDTLRRCMLKNELLHAIIPRIQELTAGGITIHAQVVACPGINDGPELERTIEELAALYPAVETLAIAPVGLTKYRDTLADIGLYSRESAGAALEMIEKYQRQFLKTHGTRFVWPTDEFYCIAEREFPTLSSYEIMSQFENGIGMCRSLVTSFRRKKRLLTAEIVRSAKSRAMVALTGKSAYPWLTREIILPAQEMGIKVRSHEVANRFWGGTVTISGLLTGSDLLEETLKVSSPDDTILLPPNCLNNDDLFLDNMTLTDFTAKAQRRVVVGSYDFVKTLQEALSDGPSQRKTVSYGEGAE